MATDKQIRYALYLADRAGLSTNWMDSSWKGYASMHQRSGKVEEFLRGLNGADISRLIDNLKAAAARRA